MSKSLSILILLPMNDYNSADVYCEDDRLKQIYGEVPEIDNYFKTLKMRSVYTSGKDLELYFQKKYQLKKEEFKNHSISYNGREYNYHFRNGTTIQLTTEEDEKLKREHVDEGVYCLPYKCLAVDIYGSVISKLLSDTFTIIDDELIDRAIKLIGCQYSSDLDFEEADSKHGFLGDNAFDIELDYEGDMDGKLLVSLIVGKYMAERVQGIAVAEYD